MGTRIFVSHSSAEKPLAKRFVRVLIAGLDIRPGDIRCTSLPAPHALPLGGSVSRALKKEIEAAEVVIGLVTPKSLQSSYVLYELGAAWGKGKTTIPLLAKGVRVGQLPPLMLELSFERLSAATQIERVVSDLATTLKIGRKPRDSVYEEAVAWLLRLAQAPKKKAPKKKAPKKKAAKKKAAKKK